MGVVAAAVLLALMAGLWMVSRIDPLPRPQAVLEDEPSETSTPAPIRVIVDPPTLPAGRTVRVTAFCPDPVAGADTGASAVSGAFGKLDLDKSSSGALYADTEVDSALPPGRYWVIVGCKGRVTFGTAELMVAKATNTPKPSGPARIATTQVTLAKARPGSWRSYPAPDRMVVETAVPDAPGLIVFELKVTHVLRVPIDDPDVTALRAGAAGGSPTQFAERRLGVVNIDESNVVLPTAFGTPVVKAEAGAREAVVTFTGVAYGSFNSEVGGYIGVEYTPPATDGNVPPLTGHEVVISATDWMVAGVSGPAPLAQDTRFLRLSGGSAARAAFAQDGKAESVAGYLTNDDQMGGYIEGPDEDEETPEEPEPGLLAQGWTVLEWVCGAAGSLFLLQSLVRAVGGAWWRRRRNWLLLAVLVTAYLPFAGVGQEYGLGWATLLLVPVLPVVTLVSAARAVPGGGRAAVAVGSAAAAATGAAAALWALMVLGAGTPVLVATIGLAIVGGAAAVVPRWRVWLPGVAFVIFGSGALLGGRALVAGVGLDTAVMATLVAVAWSVVAFAWTTEVARRWSSRAALRCAVTVSLALGVVASILIPTMWDFGDWGESHYDWSLLGLIAYGPPLLALAMLVLRARRAGQRPEGVTDATAFHTAVLFLLLLRAPALTVSGFLGVAVVLAWAGAHWLLPAAGLGSDVVRRPVSPDEHRLLVRDLIRRRFARRALTDLLRQRQAGDGFEEQHAALERAGDQRFGPVDSDLALATLAGRSPWHNAMAAFGVGTVLSLPFSAVRIVESVRSGQTAANELVIAVLAVLSLPVLCMVFGYFYPRVRGAGPIAKSLTFLLAALLVELPMFVQPLVIAAPQNANPDVTPLPISSEALIGVLVAVGNITVVSIGLGLWWEWRLVSLAGEPWARVRNVRTLRALAAPLAAVAIAIATAAATALVNNVIAPLPTVQVPPQDSNPSTLPTARP
ncbi:hypothetical protein [Nonomuraea sp. NPDC049607]|uniref:hypothetical protein n=1 Tax=Nonomuraea sp. NPDC049607 TaxID=3154732 RepID=UPI003422DD6F